MDGNGAFTVEDDKHRVTLRALKDDGFTGTEMNGGSGS